jgi:predicted metal-binding protein
MPNHVLFVCKSCNSVHSKETDYEKSEGAYLVNQLLALHQDWSRQNELEIQPAGCLWMCSHPCVVAFSGANKATYLFTKVPSNQGAEVMLQFAELYLDSHDGNIPWSKLSEPLKSGELARIPPLKVD